MELENSSTLCRICLEDGAIYPIFESNNSKDDIFSRLSRCMKEKVTKIYRIVPGQCLLKNLCKYYEVVLVLQIEDIDGFPRNICSTCNDTLETVSNFINKYKESCKILQSGLLLVKNESDPTDHYSDHYSEVEIEIKNIKTEPDVDYDSFDDNECLIDLIKPLQLKINTKELTIKKTKRPKSKPSSKNKTSRIASGLLEGEFMWTGDKWW